MIGSTRRVRVWGWSGPTDMRKGYDGLSALVVQNLGRDPLSGNIFLFVSRDRRRAKALVWDGTGLCLYAKRLEKGRFADLSSSPEGETVSLTMTELQLFLEGSRLVGKVSLSPEPFFVKKSLASSGRP